MRNRLFSMRKVILIAVIMAVLFGVSGCRDKLSDKMILTSVDLYMQRLQKRLGETDNDYIGLIAKLCSDFDYTVLESSLIRNEDESGTVTVLIYSYDTTKLFYKIKNGKYQEEMIQWLIEQRDNGRVDFTDEMILSGSTDDFDEETIETIKALINEYLRTMVEKELEGIKFVGKTRRAVVKLNVQIDGADIHVTEAVKDTLIPALLGTTIIPGLTSEN